MKKNQSTIIIESSNKNDSPVDIEEKIEKAYTAITIQREKKVFTDSFLKAKKTQADKVVKRVFQHMIEEIAGIIS
jgi:hypothetical protein